MNQCATPANAWFMTNCSCYNWGMQRQRREWQNSGMPLLVEPEQFDVFMNALLFHWTHAAKRVIND